MRALAAAAVVAAILALLAGARGPRAASRHECRRTAARLSAGVLFSKSRSRNTLAVEHFVREFLHSAADGGMDQLYDREVLATHDIMAKLESVISRDLATKNETVHSVSRMDQARYNVTADLRDALLESVCAAMTEIAPPMPGESAECQHDGAAFTIVTVPKPFTGRVGSNQRAALRTWTQQACGRAVLLLGDDESVREAAARAGTAHAAGLHYNEWGTPTLDSVYAKLHAPNIVQTDIIVFTNADIFLPPVFSAAVAAVSGPFR